MRRAPSTPKRGKGWSMPSGVRCVFLLMVLLFSVNTVLLNWHMGKTELFHSIKGQLEQLKRQIPWAKAVRETVTRSPEEPSAPHGMIRGNKPDSHVRGEVAKDIPRKEEQPKQKVEDEHIEFEYVWEESTGSTKFVRRKDGSWAEIHDGKVAFLFEQVSKKETNHQRIFELKDTSRGFTILLMDHTSMLRIDGSKNPGFTQLYGGFWAFYDGKQMENMASLGNYGDQKPPPVFMDGALKDQKIAVMLAAYRDPLCGNTLFEAFQHAQYPDRVVAIVVQQNHPRDDKDCVEDYCAIAKENGVACRRDQVKIDSVPLTHARGVMPARYRQNLLLEDEEFCLQIDSHSAFEDQWDTIALEDWSLAENEMGVITAYPNMVKDRHDQRHTPSRCSTKWSSNLEVVHGGNSALNVRPGPAPNLIPFFGAGTSFSKCHANYNVPYDPYMSHLFGGEEFNRAIRLFTSGYDMYAPKRNFVYHYYDADKKPPRGQAPRHREFFNLVGNQRQVLSSQTTARWRLLLGLPLTGHNPIISEKAMQDSKLFGLGTRRVVEQYEAFSGVNLKHGTAESRCDMLGRMKWQPYRFSTPFYPSGADCPFQLSRDIRKHCCTTLHKVLDSTKQMLAVSNDDLALLVLKSPMFPKSDNPEPVISPNNNEASKQPCE